VNLHGDITLSVIRLWSSIIGSISLLSVSWVQSIGNAGKKRALTHARRFAS